MSVHLFNQKGQPAWLSEQKTETHSHYHGLLHGDDLLTVDLPQSADVAFQSGLQSPSGLKHTKWNKGLLVKYHLSKHWKDLLTHKLQKDHQSRVHEISVFHCWPMKIFLFPVRPTVKLFSIPLLLEEYSQYQVHKNMHFMGKLFLIMSKASCSTITWCYNIFL